MSTAATPASTRVMNLAHFVTQARLRGPDDVALVWRDRTWSWAELDARIDAMAAALQDLGVVKGDRVLVQSQNCNQMFEAMFACFRVGAVYVPMNFRQTPEDVAFQSQVAGAKGMICNEIFPDHAAAAADVAFRIVIGEADWGRSYEALVEAYMGRRPVEVAVDRDDPCWFFFTSGTTGKPKASVLTHGQMGFVVTNHLCDLMPGLTRMDASLVVAPLSHGAGVHQLTQVARGVKTVLMPSERFDVATAWELIARWRVSTMFTVPTILKMMVEDASVDAFDHSSLRYVVYAGAPMFREDQKRALAKLGPVLVQYYGLGEVTGAITVLPPEHHHADDGPEVRLATCGFDRTAMQVQVQRPDGSPCDPHETGVVCAIGPAVFAGYYNNPEANAKSFRNGWFLTGDLGYVDDQGFLFLTGRESDMFISGGSNIYPREIEEKILQHPAISEVAVVGVPDPFWGEVGYAVFAVQPGQSVSEDDLAAFTAAKVARYKQPKRFIQWEALPKSAYGKITKKMIRDELAARGQLPDAEPVA